MARKQPKEVNVGMKVRVNAYPSCSYKAVVRKVRREDTDVTKALVDLGDGVIFWIAPYYLLPSFA